jgi:hypothetical protein
MLATPFLPLTVVPANAGTQRLSLNVLKAVDPGVRRGDDAN